MTWSTKRSDDPSDERNWALDCAFNGCGMRFPSTMLIGDMVDHWNTHEGQRTGEAHQSNGHAIYAEHDLPRTHLVWIGVGQPPKGKPSWIN